jgi:hypothetical protein
VIERSPTQDKRECPSSLSTVQEPNKIRSSVDGQQINQFLPCQYFKREGVLQDFLKENERKVNLKDADVVLMRRRMPTLEKAKKVKLLRERIHHLLLEIKHGLKGITASFIFVSPAGLFYNK